MIVVDASVAVLWALPQQFTEQALALLGSRHELIAPELLHLEVGGVLLRAVRRREVTAEKAREMLDRFLPQAITLVATRDHQHLPFEIALAHGGSIYDAVYIALAQTLAAPIVTADGQMLRTAKSAGLRAVLIDDGLGGLEGD